MGRAGFNWGNEAQRAERQAKALQMRLKGHTLKRIAEEVGVSVNAVWLWCKQYVDQCAEECKADAWKIIERDWEITETLIDGLLADAADGKPDAVNSMIKLLERRSKYRGLDAATKLDVNVEAIPNRDEFDQMVLDTFKRIEHIEQLNKASGEDPPALGELNPDDD